MHCLALHASHASHTHTQSDTGTLKLTGYVRGQTLSVNGLVHLPGWGDFQLLQIDAPSDPYKVHVHSSGGGVGGNVRSRQNSEMVSAVLFLVYTCMYMCLFVICFEDMLLLQLCMYMYVAQFNSHLVCTNTVCYTLYKKELAALQKVT